MTKDVNYKSLSVQNAKNFIDLVDNGNVYLFFGKTSNWTNELDPDQPVATVANEITARTNATYLKKLTVDDVMHCIPYVEWESGEVYDEYSASNASLYSSSFYVTNSSGNTYKCLDNNGGAQSTTPPSGTATSSFITADGYQWKFMFNVASNLALAFANSQYIIVPHGTYRTAQHLAVVDTATYAAGSPPRGHGFDAQVELGANRIMISKELDYSDSGFPAIEHRQFGIWISPEDDSGTEITTDEIFTASNFNEYSGRVLTVSNHEVFDSLLDSSEIVQIVISF